MTPVTYSVSSVRREQWLVFVFLLVLDCLPGRRWLQEGKDPAVGQCLDSVVHAVSHPCAFMSNRRVKRLFWSGCAHPGKHQLAPQSYHKGIWQLPEEVMREQSSKVWGDERVGENIPGGGNSTCKGLATIWPGPWRTMGDLWSALGRKVIYLVCASKGSIDYYK